MILSGRVAGAALNASTSAITLTLEFKDL